MLNHLLLISNTTQKIEDEINTLYAVISYAIPFGTALIITLISAYFYIARQVGKNRENIDIMVKATNGSIDDIKAQLQDIHTKVSTPVIVVPPTPLEKP